MGELGVSPATVRQAVSELVRSGKVETIPGSGTFVARPPDRRREANDLSWQTLALGAAQTDVDLLAPIQSVPTADTIDLASGYPDESLQPVGLLARAMRSAARRPGTFGRAPSEGLAPLRDWFAAQLSPQREHNILVVPGGQAALSLTFRALGMAGDVVLTESPTYVGAIAAARAAGLTTVPVPMDRHGVLVDQLEAAVEQTGARLLYLQPRFHNPTGACLSRDRRDPLMALAVRHHLVIVEDEWLCDLDDPKTAQPSLASRDPDGHVVHVRSLTKSVAPAMRVAGLAATGPIAQRLHQTRSAEDFFVSPIMQETALNVVTSPGWSGHLRQLRLALAERQASLLASVSEIPDWGPDPRRGPLHAWLETPQGINADALRDAALRHGVAIVSGTSWHPADSAGSHIRLSIAASPPSQIVEGITRLGQAIETMRS